MGTSGGLVCGASGVLDAGAARGIAGLPYVDGAMRRRHSTPSRGLKNAAITYQSVKKLPARVDGGRISLMFSFWRGQKLWSGLWDRAEGGSRRAVEGKRPDDFSSLFPMPFSLTTDHWPLTTHALASSLTNTPSTSSQGEVPPPGRWRPGGACLRATAGPAGGGRAIPPG